jgi:RHS repeat-associated protein
MTRRLALLLLLAGLSTWAMADDPSAGSTPSALTPGAPAGAHALSGFENINYYNGSLNFSLPLHPVEGRGGAAMSVTLAIEQHWSVKSSVLGEPKPGVQWWTDWFPGYGPGILLGRRVADGRVCSGGTFFQTSVTRLTFTAADRTEYEMRDVLTDGEPIHIACGTNIPERGTDFVTTDGSAATFRSDTVIRDGTVNQQGSTATVIRPSGFLMLRDGTRYRIDNGLVSWLRDRNGNRLTFVYEEQQGVIKPRVTQITDSLNRRVTVQYPPGQDVITFKGFGGEPRTVIVYRTNLGNAFPPESPYTVKQLRELFPGLTDFPDLNDPQVASGVVLPNGQAYTFYYNEYAELEDVYLPTGGRFHYAYQAGLNDGEGGETGWFQGTVRLAIYRRLKERTVYGNSNLELRTTISRPENKASTLGFVEVDQLSATGVRLRRERHFFFGRAAKSLDQTSTAYSSWRDGKEHRTETVSAGGAVLRRVDHAWQQRAPVGWWTGLPDDAPPKDPRLVSTRTELDGGVFSWQVFDYDTYNNRTRVSEHGFGALPGSSQPIRRTETDFLTNNGNPPVNYATDLSIHIRDLPLQERLYQSDGAAPPAERARTTHEYDVHAGDGHAPLVPRPGISGLDPGYASTALTTRGNRTATTRWLDVPGGTVTEFRHYDVAGNVVRAIDPRGQLTVFDFVDRYGSPDGNARQNTPPPELGDVGQTSFAFASWVQNPKGHLTFTQRDYNLGLSVDQEDANGVVDSVSYDDSLDRPREVLRAQVSRTRFEYEDAPPNPRVHSYSDKDATADGKIHTDVFYDSLGREASKLIFEITGTETEFIVSDGKNYDGLGRLTVAYNPFRLSETIHSTSTQYDALDRVTLVQGPDGATSTTTYAANVTTTTDPAGKRRSSVTDALGRRTTVVEDPGPNQATTSYAYDAFDNVVRVVQDTQQRTFAYDSLSRLICASDPEARVGGTACTAPLPASGAVRYGYDANGNLITRTDARGIASTFTYDPLDRIETKTYTGGTPGVTYAYDGAVLGKGRLWSYTSLISGQAWGSANDEYDGLGRVRRSRQTSAGSAYAFTYGHDLAGNLVSMTYPTGRVVTTTYDPAGRARRVAQGGYAFGDVPADQDYSAHGGLLRLKLGVTGSGLQRWRQVRYNCHLQQRLAGLGSSASGTDILGLILEHGTDNSCAPVPGDPGNNGNLLRQKIVVNGLSVRFTQAYEYDGANRLRSARETEAGGAPVWAQTYGYDRWGNRFVPTGYVPSVLTPRAATDFDPSNNRIRASLYDDAGNQTRDALGRTFTYDAENRQTAAGSTGYVYDGEGRRVRKVVGGTPTTYVYDAFGRLAAEYGSGSARLGTRFLIADHVASTRLTINERGEVSKTSRHDYLPFGEELPATAAFFRADYGAEPGVRHRFAGKERDLETDLDYFGARYFSAPQGRFTSVDPVQNWGANLGNPQRWNRYAYALNNPLRIVDPDGRDTVDLGIGFLQGIRNVAVGVVTTPIALATNPRGVVRGLAQEVKLLGYGLANPGEVLNTYVNLATSNNDADQRALGAAFGQGAATAAVVLAPTAKGAPVAAEASTLRPGPFAGESITLRGPGRNFTTAERTAVDKIGSQTGCHTCGTTTPGTKSGHFVIDHQPPVALAPPGTAFRGYPHCTSCSFPKQANEVRAALTRAPGE